MDSPLPCPEPGRVPRPQRVSGGWQRWLPGVQMLRGYDIAWLRHDVVAGLVLAAMLVPAGIAYAVASGVPGIYGLYATIVPLLAYAVFGPSRILVLGPDSALVALILVSLGIKVQPISIAASPYARSAGSELIAVGSAEDIKQLEQLVQSLDVPQDDGK